MTPQKIQEAVVADHAALQAAFLAWAEKTGLECTTPRFAQDWRAWEWCRRQLLAQGFTEAEIEERFRPLKGYKQETYEAIAACIVQDGL